VITSPSHRYVSVVHNHKQRLYYANWTVDNIHTRICVNFLGVHLYTLASCGSAPKDLALEPLTLLGFRSILGKVGLLVSDLCGHVSYEMVALPQLTLALILLAATTTALVSSPIVHSWPLTAAISFSLAYTSAALVLCPSSGVHFLGDSSYHHGHSCAWCPGPQGVQVSNH
jgi:hypothetical protein